MKNVVNNFFYQAIFQLTKIILPIITIPIVSKAIGPSGIGTYNYVNSIAQYFVLFAGLGIGLYGNREIALAWNKKENVSKVFWEIVQFKGILSIASFLVYLIITIFFQNKILFLVQSLIILGVFFDISWFFMGIEDFKKTSIANLFSQIISFALIILLVKDSSDVFIYVVIQTLSVIVPQVVVWFFVKQYIHFEKVSIKESFSHFRGAVSFFIPQVAILLYTNLNKTILGYFIGESSVGFYTNSLTLNTVFITFITTMDTVLLPHMSGLFAKNNIKKIVKTMDATLHLQLFISIPVMFGMLAVFDKLIPWFFGEKFSFITNVVPFFSVLIVVTPLGLAISRQYLLPIGKIQEYNRSVFIGAIINIVTNLILLPIVGFFGVVFANILAECFVTFVRSKSFVKNTGFKFSYRKIFSYFLAAFIMCVITRYFTKSMPATLTTNLIQVVVALPIYWLLTTLFKTNPINNYVYSFFYNKKK